MELAATGSASVAGTDAVGVVGHAMPESRPLMEIASELLQVIEGRFARSDLDGPTTGLADLDELLGPLRPGSVTIVGSPTASGRTTLALGVALHVARTTGTTLFASNELTTEDVATRALAIMGELSATKLRTGHLTESDWTKFRRAMARSSLPLFVDSAVRTVETLNVARQNLALESARGVVVVDGLDPLVKTGRETAASVSRELRSIRALIDESRMPFILTTRLRVNPDKTDSPALTDLQFDGALEDFADVIVVLQPTPRSRAVVEAHVLKNRYGPTGTAELAFRRTIPVFGSLASESLERLIDDDDTNDAQRALCCVDAGPCGRQA
jgi:replicative DNA helicase